MSEQFNEFGPFAVGEVCRIVGAEYFPELIGREVTIAGPRQRATDTRSGEPYDGYPVDMIYKGYYIIAQESCLRRRRPPTSDSNERMYMKKWREMADKAPQRVGEPA